MQLASNRRGFPDSPCSPSVVRPPAPAGGARAVAAARGARRGLRAANSDIQQRPAGGSGLQLGIGRWARSGLPLPLPLPLSLPERSRSRSRHAQHTCAPRSSSGAVPSAPPPSLPDTPRLLPWPTPLLLQLLAGHGDWERALGVHRAMGLAGARPDSTTAGLLVAACMQGGNQPLAAKLAAVSGLGSAGQGGSSGWGRHRA